MEESEEETPGGVNESHQPNNIPPMPPPNPRGDKKRMSDARVFGLNFLIFIGYTVLCLLAADGGGFILDGFLLLIHLITCLILAGVHNRWAWGVAGLAVFLVGVSVCASGGLGLIKI